MKNIPLKTTQDYSRLIGIPYEKKDCWGIVVSFYKTVFDIELNPYYQEIPKTKTEAQTLVHNCLTDFHTVPKEQAKFGDIILVKILGFESHIAVYLGEGKILHTQYKTGCVIDSLSRWEKLVVGFYRAKGIEK